jgi:hypothetical protein
MSGWDKFDAARGSKGGLHANSGRAPVGHSAFSPESHKDAISVWQKSKAKQPMTVPPGYEKRYQNKKTGGTIISPK